MAAACPGSSMPDADSGQKWDRELVPKRGLLSVSVSEIWRYRDLVRQLASRDLSAQYKQTVLGPAWFVIQPLMATVVFSFLFGRVAKLGTEGVPHFLFYMGGLVPWAFFADLVNKTSLTFTKNAQLFGKVYFPRLVAPLAQVLTSSALFAVQFAVFLAGFGFYLWKSKSDPSIHLDPSWRIALLPLLLLQMTMLGAGIGLIVSSLSTRYRDLSMSVSFGLQLWMYASSVVFPLSKIQEPRYRELMALNPMVPVIEGFRFAFLGTGTVTQAQLATSFGISAIVLLLGLMMFNRTEQTVMDTV